MKALIGRDTDGWGTRGFVARLENGQTVAAANATELVRQLRAAGVDAITVAISDEGDRSLSAAFKAIVDASSDLDTNTGDRHFGFDVIYIMRTSGIDTGADYVVFHGERRTFEAATDRARETSCPAPD